MCAFSGPKAAPPPPPPPPPPEEPPVAPVFDPNRAEREERGRSQRARQIGRSALRVDLQTPSAANSGVQVSKS